MSDATTPGAVNAQIEFIDLAAQRRRIGRRMDEAILRVVDHGKYIMGPEVAELEKELAAYCGAKHVLSCANGTDALGLALMAKNLKLGQAVLVPSFTFAATAEVVAWFDAVPVFVDVREDTFNMDPVSLEAGVATVKRSGLEPVGVIPVDLFGLPADYDRVSAPVVGHLRRSAELWRRIQEPEGRNHHQHDELLSGQAARLLRRWRRDIHRRRRYRRDIEEPQGARAGLRQVRQCARRHERAPRYDPGGGAARETVNLR